MGVNNLLMVFLEDYYKHLSGGILEVFGKFFRKDMQSLSLSLQRPSNSMNCLLREFKNE